MQRRTDDSLISVGALVAVFGTRPAGGGGYVALELRFAQGSLRLTCDDDTDEVIVEMWESGPSPARDDLGADGVFAPLVGKELEYVWWLTNHRGYEDGLQMRLVNRADGTEVAVQFEVAGSVLWPRTVLDGAATLAGSNQAEDRPGDDLDPADRELLARGLGEWGGPARATDALAQAMGFADRRALSVDGARIADAPRAGESLGAEDWGRALVATEIVFASDLHGSGCEWETTTGLTDAETIRRLREVQRRLAGVARRA